MHGERWEINISFHFLLHRISVPVSPRSIVQWFLTISHFSAHYESQGKCVLERHTSTHLPESDETHPGPFSRSNERENSRKSVSKTYIRRVGHARQPRGPRCRAFSLCLNANKFVLLSVPNLMTICLKFENMGKTAGHESKKVHIQLTSVARLSLSFIKY